MIIMNSCEEIRSELTHFVVAQLDAQTTLAVARHLATCAECGTEEAALRRTTLLLREWKPAPLRSEVTANIQRAATAELAALRQRPAPKPRGLGGLTWNERWESLLEAARVARPHLAPVAFAFLALATLCALLLLIRDPAGAHGGAMFLGGLWCATVANGVLGLVFGETHARKVMTRFRIDLRATALSATLAGGLVVAAFLLAGLVKAHWVGEFDTSELLRVVLYSVASFLIVGAAVAAAPRFVSFTRAGRISGAMVGFIYSAFAGPLVYIVIGFRLDAFWLQAVSAIFVFAVAGGLMGDSLALRRGPAAR